MRSRTEAHGNMYPSRYPVLTSRGWVACSMRQMIQSPFRHGPTPSDSTAYTAVMGSPPRPNAPRLSGDPDAGGWPPCGRPTWDTLEARCNPNVRSPVTEA